MPSMSRISFSATALAFTALMSTATMSLAQPSTDAPSADPRQWLEEVQGERALAWVKERNQLTLSELQARPEYPGLRREMLDLLNASDRIPHISRKGAWVYNLWQDQNHKRGLWRRSSLAEYKKASPAWETVLDLDALGAAEGESWVFAGAHCLAPEYRRCLISLSRGGSDAHVLREFDTVSKQFVSDGFVLPEAKSEVSWIDADHIYVASDFGPGSLTDSGYPRVIKRWQRGTPLAQARTVFEGQAQDVAVSVMVDRTPGHERTVFSRALDFYNQRYFLLQSDKLRALDVPTDVQLSFWGARALLQPRKDWRVGGVRHAAGSLLSAPAAAFIRGERKFSTLFKPSATRSLDSYITTPPAPGTQYQRPGGQQAGRVDLCARPPGPPPPDPGALPRHPASAGLARQRAGQGRAGGALPGQLRGLPDPRQPLPRPRRQRHARAAEGA